jgi:hypothetical protein
MKSIVRDESPGRMGTKNGNLDVSSSRLLLVGS